MTNLHSRNRPKPSFLRQIGSLVWSVRAVLSALWTHGLGWLLPMVLALLVLAALLALIAGTGPLAPFIYPIL